MQAHTLMSENPDQTTLEHTPASATCAHRHIPKPEAHWWRCSEASCSSHSQDPVLWPYWVTSGFEVCGHRWAGHIQELSSLDLPLLWFGDAQNLLWGRAHNFYLFRDQSWKKLLCSKGQLIEVGLMLIISKMTDVFWNQWESSTTKISPCSLWVLGEPILYIASTS